MQKKLNFKNSIGQKLVGILYSPEKNKNFPIVILCHGYRSCKENSKSKTFGKILPNKGVGFFTFDFSGRGESEGKFENTTITQYIDDLKCCIDLISKKTKEVIVLGSSLGGFISLNEMVNEARVTALVLFSPVSRFPWRNKEEFERLKEWKEKGYTYTDGKRFGMLKIKYNFYEDGIKYSSYEVYKKIKIPTLIIHGKKDKSVSHKDSMKLKSYIKNSRLKLLKDADHIYTDKKDFDKMTKETEKFIMENLK